MSLPPPPTVEKPQTALHTKAKDVGGMITVQDTAGVNELDPSVTLERTGGQFVVAYDTGQGVQANGFRSDDTQLSTLEQVDGISPALGIDGFGRDIVTYTHFNGSTGHFDIFSRRDVLG
jgi:hypothetical protein